MVAPPPLESEGAEIEVLMGGCSPTTCSALVRANVGMETEWKYMSSFLIRSDVAFGLFALITALHSSNFNQIFKIFFQVYIVVFDSGAGESFRMAPALVNGKKYPVCRSGFGKYQCYTYVLYT